MPYCPRCRCEYAPGVMRCPDCGVLLRDLPPKRPPGRPPTFIEDLYVPGAALLTLLVSAGLLYLRLAAEWGQVPEPFGSMVRAQPPCFTAFYAIATVAAAAILALGFLNWLIRRD